MTFRLEGARGLVTETKSDKRKTKRDIKRQRETERDIRRQRET